MTAIQDESQLSPAEQEAWNLVKKFNHAFAENDPDTYFTCIDDDIVVIIPGSPYRIEGIGPDREEFEYSLERGFTRIGYFQMLQPDIRLMGEVAVVTYYSRGSYGPEEKTAYLKETDVLYRYPDGWKIVHIHVSRTG